MYTIVTASAYTEHVCPSLTAAGIVSSKGALRASVISCIHAGKKILRISSGTCMTGTVCQTHEDRPVTLLATKTHWQRSADGPILLGTVKPSQVTQRHYWQHACSIVVLVCTAVRGLARRCAPVTKSAQIQKRHMSQTGSIVHISEHGGLRELACICHWGSLQRHP
jgi:hypothetical protein